MRAHSHPNYRPRGELAPELRRVAVPRPVREWICQNTGFSVVSVRRLAGASSTAVHGVRLADGTVRVRRRYVWEKFRLEEPEAPVRVVDALNYAAQHQLAVPTVVAADPTGSEVGDGIPALLMTRVPGRPVATPDVVALAALAARIHAVGGFGFEHGYFPWCRDTSTVPHGGVGAQNCGTRRCVCGGPPNRPTSHAASTETSTPANS
jgi:hypothetical protein